MSDSYLALPLVAGVVIGGLGWFAGRPLYALVLWATMSTLSAWRLRQRKQLAAAESRFLNEMQAR